jgi:hypothetical protein
MLRPLVLTLYNDAGWEMGDSNGGIGRVDVLPASPCGPVGVNPQVFVVDLDFDIFVDFGIYEERGERGMPPRGLIER